MMEIMVVVFIIGLLASLVGPKLIKRIAKGKETATKATMASIKDALIEYYQDVGHFPNKAEGGLDALVEKPSTKSATNWRGPYLSGGTVPLDKWGNEFEYNCPPERFSSKYQHFELIAESPDGDVVLDVGS
jgi:general secretion pathway protein G